MNNIPMNRAARRAAFKRQARYATSVLRGRQKIEAFIARGIRINSRNNKQKSIVSSIRRAIIGA